MGRRNLKAVGLFHGVKNTPTPSTVTDCFDNLALNWFGAGANGFLINSSTAITPDATSKAGGFSFWIKITDDVVNYAGSGGQVGIMCLNGLSQGLYSKVNVNLVDISGNTHVQFQAMTGSFPAIALSTLQNSLCQQLTVNQWHNITVKFYNDSGTGRVTMYVDGTQTISWNFVLNVTHGYGQSGYVIGATNPTSPVGSPNYLKFAKLNHLILYSGVAIDPVVMYNNGLPYYPPTTLPSGFKALYSVRSSIGSISANRLSVRTKDSALGNVDFFPTTGFATDLSPVIKISTDFTFPSQNNEFTRTLERFHQWADTTTAIDGLRAFSGAVTNGMFMRPAYLPFQTGIGINTPATSTVGAIDKKITSFADVKPLTASYVDDWPNAPSVFGGSKSMYRKAHENTYPTQTIGSITVNNYKAVAPTKAYFTPSFS